MAVMAITPATPKLTVIRAVPSGPTGIIPRITLPAWNVTLPAGVPAPGATAATVAVKVTAWPTAAGLTDDARPTVVAAWVTVSGTNADLLGAKVLLPT